MKPTGVTKGRPAASDISPGGQSMASLDHRRPSHDIVQDDIVGSLPYFTADRLLVTRVHRITAAHSHRSQIVGSAAGTSADDSLLGVFLNHDSRPTAQILTDTSHDRESPQHPAVTSDHGHRRRRAHLFLRNSAGAASTLREIMDSSFAS